MPHYLRAIPLTNLQWTRSVQNILNLEAPPKQADSFLAPPTGFTLFPNNEKVLELTNAMRESYTNAAAELAAELASTAGAVARIDAGTNGPDFVRSFGRRAFRRPLTDEEVTRYQAVFDVGAALSGDATEFDKGAAIVVEAMLQSPHFLYRTELVPQGEPLTNYEIASKLSFWLLNTSPNEALLDRVAAGELDDAAGAARVAREMLEEEAAAETGVEMFAEMFRFVRYSSLTKASDAFDPAMREEADATSRLFFEKIYKEGSGLREVLTSTRGYVGPQLAALYGVAPPNAIEEQDLGADRVGFFSQVPYLMLFGNNESSDAIHRGLFINFQVLCAELPEPNFDLPKLPSALPGQNDREYIEFLTGPGTCGATCHGAYINPLGFAFENFDGMGRLRSTDKEKPVNTKSAYPFVSGYQNFNGSRELMPIIAESDEAHRCFAKNIASYGLQRDIVESDQELLDHLAAVSKTGDGSLKNLMAELVQTPDFLTRQGAAQ